ncbi:putative sugar ABC transporter, periplasmic binding protein [Bradyrhizobium sp. ORS 278]|uniref:ABC transporter substrate-binding protein n=1 Tax=Bradyrhizobium sp. (strain ORS 278) TaxID=114615 RepID=UPI0001508370|nr:extracellular solute-binding protein [Bradyrhizobium sp. ORS 278]CAL78139.1 putative sugar ABC transporter, periplasmic binding protein [Bradyrhizobium sp. ORS 278]
MRAMTPLITSVLLSVLWATALNGPAWAETVTLRMAWYSDGNEGEVMTDLLKRFHDQNKDIEVVLDQVPYKAINENLPVQLASGQGPDMARVVDMGGLSRYALDMRPLLKDPGYWDANFGPFLAWMRPAGDTQAIPGFMTQLTVTGPFVNKTLFEQAGVPTPGDRATWEDWAKAVKEVAAKVQAPFPLALDRSGHRFYALAMSQGAQVFAANGEPDVVDDGFKRAAQLIYDWHKSGVMSKELWGSVSGTAYRGANDEFKNAQVVMYLSGSWQIAQFAKTVGNAFDWVAVPNPCGPGGCSSMPGGAGLIAFKSTQHPKEVARLMEYLASEPVLAEFYARTLFVPGHLGLAKKGVDYPTASPEAAAALKVFTASAAQISPLAYRTQGYINSRIIFNAVISRLGQAVSGETTLDEAYKRITADVSQQIAERNKK